MALILRYIVLLLRWRMLASSSVVSVRPNEAQHLTNSRNSLRSHCGQRSVRKTPPWIGPYGRPGTRRTQLARFFASDWPRDFSTLSLLRSLINSERNGMQRGRGELVESRAPHRASGAGASLLTLPTLQTLQAALADATKVRQNGIVRNILTVRTTSCCILR